MMFSCEVPLAVVRVFQGDFVRRCTWIVDRKFVENAWSVGNKMLLTEPISVDELRDLAILETLGLLEEVDEAKFERAFAGLSPDQQAELLDLQSAVAVEIAAAGDEEPDRALRYKVLARLASEIDQDASACGPIASIGERVRAIGSDARSTPGLAPAEADANLMIVVRRMRRSSMIWRAATFVLGSSLIALVVIQQQTTNLSSRLLDLADNNISLKELQGKLDGIGFPENDARLLFDSTTARSVAMAGSTGAGILVIEEAGEAPGHGMMMLFDMPDSTMVRLVAFEPGSTEVPVVLYEGEVGRFSASPIDLQGRSLQGLAFEIREAGTDKVLLKNSLA